MSEQLAGSQGEPTAELLRLYTEWGKGDMGLIITGNVMVSHKAISEPGQVVIEDYRHLGALERWARAARQGGAQAWMQINHAGRQVPALLSRNALAPSAVRQPGRLFASPRALTESEVQSLVHRYATTAAVAVRAGFTGVQIHAAHGYLISQFLSPSANQRDDAYGGCPARRVRFLLEVIDAVRGAIGPHAAIGVKLNASDFMRGGADPQEVLQQVGALSRTSVDLLEVSGGTFNAAAMLGLNEPVEGALPHSREGYFLSFAAAARQVFQQPIMVTGGFRTPEAMNAALASGAVDLIGAARPFAIDTRIAARWLYAQPLPLPETSVGAPERSKARGLLGGLMEIAWYTGQLWRLAKGRSSDPRAARWRATAHYLLRQMHQMYRLQRKP